VYIIWTENVPNNGTPGRVGTGVYATKYNIKNGTENISRHGGW